jgi:AAHS family 4-hydroxybenzoate transporter-like MFS transporter
MNDVNGASVNVENILDSARFRGLPLLVMACAAAVMVLDGFDIQVIGFAAPALATEWGIDRSALAPAFAAALIGMAVGAFTLGPLGDRYGRRPAILLSVAFFGMGTLATAWAPNLEALIALRFLTGIGLGGALPNATALMAEFAPPKVRGQAIVAAIVGVPIGGMLGASIAAEIIPSFGWRAIFQIGGVMPLVAGLVLYFTLPESARFLATQPARSTELARILNRIVNAPRFSASQTFSPASQASAPQRAGLRAILSRELLLDTLALWVIFVTNLFAVYAFYNWASVVLTNIGLDLATAVRGSLIFNTAGVVGSVLASWLIARLGSRWLQAILGVIGVAAMLYVGNLVSTIVSTAGPVPAQAIMIALAIAGFCILGVQVTMYAVAAHVYPTHCRAAGVGWAVGIGRLGGVLSAFAGGVLMARVGVSAFFVAIAGILSLTVIAILILRKQIAPALTHSAQESRHLGCDQVDKSAA